ncbi:DUF6134 family protein [Zunongwangia pacifica]|uniref:MORN repeat variant n=1 Tax=Zunongwangia pacifica TaxID=2911062 RepID=A0A9X1ZP21_9FLAO|nr:DUF6134 family protein [Zunongwangia pacifica]MCL6217374.1 hypothetical protein [Zunongwangia pacifica]
MKFSIVFIAFLVMQYNAVAQDKSFSFEVIHKENKIGTLEAIKKISGDITEYQTETNIETRILAKIEVNYNFQVVFNGHHLKNTEAEIFLNGKNRTSTKTISTNGGTYKFYDSGKLEKTINSPISYTCIQLMFEEPIGFKKAYSEETGEFQTLRKIGSHSYAKENEKGRESIYYYKNGILQTAKIDAGIIEFELHLQPL